MAKKRIVREGLFEKGVKQSFDVTIHEVVGMALAKLHFYKDEDVPGQYSEAFFYPDEDYEIIIQPKKK